MSPKTFIGVYLHVKLETLRVNQALETQIYEWHELDSSKIEYIVFACERLGESFIGLGESSRESLIFPLFACMLSSSESRVDSLSWKPDSSMEGLGESMP